MNRVSAFNAPILAVTTRKKYVPDHKTVYSTAEYTKKKKKLVSSRKPKQFVMPHEQPQRTPHCLRLDNKRLVYTYCEIYTIPEDGPLCYAHQAMVDCSVMGRLHRSKTLDAEGFGSHVQQIL